MIRAAKYLGVAPWDLVEQPAVWMDWALIAEKAEFAAREEAHRQRRPRAGPGG